MKIAVATTSSIDSLGGDGRVAQEFAEVLSQDREVLLILSGKKGQVSPLSSKVTHFFVSGLLKGNHTLPLLTPNLLKDLPKALRGFSPDIIHLHDQGPVPFVVLLWALKHNIPVVFTCHTIPSEVVSFGLSELFPKAKKLFDNKIFDSYFDFFLKKASGIIAINNSILKDLKNTNIKTPTFLVNNGRNLEMYNKVTLPNITSSPKRILFIGFLSHRKNQRFLIEVLSYLPKNEYVLDLIGIPLEEAYLEELQNLAKDLNVSVNFIGRVSHEDVPKYLEKAHFFVSASLMEVQSLAVIEALASGTPVISLNNETTEELVNEKVGYNFPQDTAPETFAKKIMEYSHLSSQDYEVMCMNCRERVSHMDWQQVKEKTLEVYKDLIANSQNDSSRRLKDMLKGIPKDVLNILVGD